MTRRKGQRVLIKLRNFHLRGQAWLQCHWNHGTVFQSAVTHFLRLLHSCSPTLPPLRLWLQTMDLCHPAARSQGIPPSSKHNVSTHFPRLSQQDENNSWRNYGHVRWKILSKLQLVHKQRFHKVSFSYFEISLGEEKNILQQETESLVAKMWRWISCYMPLRSLNTIYPLSFLSAVLQMYQR